MDVRCWEPFFDAIAEIAALRPELRKLQAEIVKATIELHGPR